MADLLPWELTYASPTPTPTPEPPPWERDYSTPTPTPTPSPEGGFQFLPRSGAQMDVSEGRQVAEAAQPFIENPQVGGVVTGLSRAIPRSLSDLVRMGMLPREGDVDEQMQQSEEWGKAVRGEYGPVEQTAALTQTAMAAAPLLHIPFREGIPPPLRTEPLMPEPPPTQPIGPGTTAADVSNALDWTPQSPPITPLESTIAKVQPPGPYVSPETGFTHYPGFGEGHVPIPSETTRLPAPPTPRIGASLQPIPFLAPDGSTPAFNAAQSQAPPQTVRLYHGGAGEQAGSDFTTDLGYAQGYANKTPGGRVWQVDVPQGLIKTHDEYGQPMTRVVVPDHIANQARPLTPLPYTPEAAAARSQQPSGAQPSEGVGGNVAGFEKVYGPGEIPAGPTLTPEDAWDAAHARAQSGKAQPYGFVDRARSGAITPEEMGDLIYEHHRLVERAAGMEGTPEYDGAYQAAKDFAANVLKPAETAWSQKGITMQIARPVDLTNMTGMDQLMQSELGRGIKPSEAPKFKQMSKDIQNGESEVKQAVARSDAKVQRSYAKVADIPIEEAVARVKQMLKDCM